MFHSYDLTDFGKEVRRVRQRCGFTQLDVSSLTGINTDTLRRIENGSVIVKYETLEILSSVYKCDLLRLLQTSRTNEYLYSYYERIDNAIVNNDGSLIDKLIQDYKTFVENGRPSQLRLINSKELVQFESFLKSIRLYHKNEKIDKTSIKSLTTTLSLTLPNFDINNYSTFNYNLLEIRILLLVSLFLGRVNDFTMSTEILTFILSYLLENDNASIHSQQLILKIYCNISYNCHRIDDDLAALKYANEGIEYAVKNENMHALFLLYARKGIAEFCLGYDNYLDSLQKSIYLLEICNKHELADTYRKITYEKYKITI